jgi:hypothetical protein
MTLKYRHLAVAILLTSLGFAASRARTVAPAAPGTQEPQLTQEQMRDFLLNAKVIKSKSTQKGVTGVARLTLSDGNLTHDASFQSIDEYKSLMKFETGRVEANFRDSYKYNIAAYEVALLLGLGDMMPVTVSRKWGGKTGSLSWWLPAKLDEETRQRKKIKPPDENAWAKQMNKMWVFSQLLYDTDRNMGNVLFSEDWHLWIIDFSRAFRLYSELEDPKKLVQCDRNLLENLRKMNAAELEAKTKQYLTGLEIRGIMTRRDKIVQHFDRLIAEKGESKVIY